MATRRLVLVGSCTSLLLVMVAGCHSTHPVSKGAAPSVVTPSPSPAPTASTPVSQPFGRPPVCAYPTGVTLLTLEEDSTIVVTATLPGSPTGGPRATPTLSGATYDLLNYPTALTNVKVLSRAPSAPSAEPTTLIGIFPFYEPPGDYVLFLHQAVGNGALAEPAHGLGGMFQIWRGNLVLQCFDGVDPKPLIVPGTVDEATFVAGIPSVLPTLP
jgi:hypothetical protein